MGTRTGSFSNRSLAPDGTHGYWKEGDTVESGGTKSIKYILHGGRWIKAQYKTKNPKTEANT